MDSSNTHSHATVMTEKDFLKLSPQWKRRVAREYQNCLVFVKLVGVVTLSRGYDVFLGLKIETHEYNELREETGLDPIETPHINTTHLWRSVYERRVKGAEEHHGTFSLSEQKGGGEDQLGASPL